MEKRYMVVFDEVVKEKLQRIIEQSSYRKIVKSWLDDLEDKGPNAGKLLDNHVWLYEMKNKHPPLRLYFHHQKFAEKVLIFEVEMKTSEKRQRKTIDKLRYRLSRFLNLFVYTPFSLNSLNTREDVYKD